MTTAEQTPANAPATGATPAKPKYTRRQVALAIVALSIGGFAVGVTEFAIMGLQLEAVADLGITIPQAGMLISAYAIGVVVGAPILSILGAKRERKSYALLLLGVFVFGHVLSFFAPNYETMLLARFLSGLPHGAYFAVAALMAAEMAGPAKRSRAIAVVLGGLAISNVLGVPLVTALGQAFGWRWMFISVIVLALITMVAVARYAPRQMPPAKATMRSEIKGLKNKRLWVGIMLAVVGFSGMFALYSYIAPVSTEITGFSESSLPWVVGLFGAGMVVGNFVGGWAADKSVLGTVVIAMTLVAVFMVLFASTAHIPALMLIFLFLVGVSASALGPSMQTHLIDTAPDAPQLAASLHHSAFNAANALGALVGGQVIAAEMGLRAPSYVGAGAAVLGVMVALYAIHLTRKMKTPRTAI
ncbi:MFS transporter [Nesterenkonia sandarakina]|uniref:DHA1 family inner membrane transport protein n=1 Tax=Nesterenkonia sandarakina TaxID=272918 RepID=A0A7Z0J3L3_9MICC|nr:MFS transporter [Nesterenkonia sandarakina]NYJ16984.1 DHA1 family inner membrane transport protein [Nesterenkonia sandarakina]